MKIKYFIHFILGFLLFSFNRTNQHKKHDFRDISDQMFSKVEQKLSKRYSMNVFGEGSGGVDKVNLVCLSFEIHGPLGKGRLREIIVDSVEEFLKEINANEELRPFLKNYPFIPNQIEIAIFPVDKHGLEIVYPNISVAASYGGKIKYNSTDEDNSIKYKKTETEDYETAKDIVKNSQKIIPENNENKESQ